MFIGPDNKGNFREIFIKSIQCKRVPVKLVRQGQIAAIAVNLIEPQELPIEKLKVRKGMVITSFLPEATWSFEAEVWPLDGH